MVYDQYWSMVNQINVNHKFIDNKFGKQSSKMPSRGLQRSLLSHDVTSPYEKVLPPAPGSEAKRQFLWFFVSELDWNGEMDLQSKLSNCGCGFAELDCQMWGLRLQKRQVWDFKELKCRRFETARKKNPFAAVFSGATAAFGRGSALFFSNVSFFRQTLGMFQMMFSFYFKKLKASKVFWYQSFGL